MNRINRKRVLTISLSWLFIGIFLGVYDHFTLISHIAAGPDEKYTFMNGLLFHMGAGFSGGFVGSFVLIYVNDRYRSAPYYKGLTLIVVSYVLITGTITIITSALPATLSFSFLSDEWYELFREHLLTTYHIKNILFWASVVAITYFFLQMTNKFGPGNLRKVLTGTYNIPKTEDRIFMFLDLKSSTSIAEELGSEQYHTFLKMVFDDITNPIMKSNGDIYQYVGDEVVISWPLNKRESPLQCLTCFYDIKTYLTQLKDKYMTNFRYLPQFKAGVHCGSVVAGEIGVIKRDITYSGDILNTTARIQGQCNNLNSELLISNSLFKLVDSRSEWNFISKGAIELRGKGEKISLFEVTKE